MTPVFKPPNLPNMFKKPARIKTASALKNSDRKKLRAQVVNAFGILTPEFGDILVPEGLQSAKFTTQGDVPGTLYLDKGGDPLWFTLGKTSTELIPTVYTLWKIPLLLTFSTSAPAMEKVMGGADLMIPGVFSMSYHLPNALLSLPEDALAAITTHGCSIPLAIGRASMPSDELKVILQSDREVKGKAVILLHSHRDSLWEVGSKAEAPSAFIYPEAGFGSDGVGEQHAPEQAPKSVVPTETETQAATPGSQQSPDDVADGAPSGRDPSTAQALPSSEIDEHLRFAVLHALSMIHGEQVPSPFPLPATAFFTSHMQPGRPHWAPALDLKKSSFKTLTKFLKSVEKEGILRLKEHKGDVTVVSADLSHPVVAGHRKVTTAGMVDAKEKSKADKEKEDANKVKPIAVTELWKPNGQSLAFFEALQKSTSERYKLQDIRALMDEYILKNSMVHPKEQQYIVLDQLLQNVMRRKGEEVEFLRRDEVVSRLLELMQPWHTLVVPGKDPVSKKGQLIPISVVVKLRQGRKACTLVTGFELFGITAEFLAEELKRACASATTYGLIQGAGKASTAQEVMVQGKHIPAIQNLIISQGVPKKYIKTADETGGKK